jgi:hypothetical protein
VGGSAFGEHPQGFFWRVCALETDTLKALFDEPVDGHFIAEEPIFRVFGFKQIKGVGEKFGWLMKYATRELPLDALFKNGIERKRHGESIR